MAMTPRPRKKTQRDPGKKGHVSQTHVARFPSKKVPVKFIKVQFQKGSYLMIDKEHPLNIKIHPRHRRSDGKPTGLLPSRPPNANTQTVYNLRVAPK